MSTALDPVPYDRGRCKPYTQPPPSTTPTNATDSQRLTTRSYVPSPTVAQHHPDDETVSRTVSRPQHVLYAAQSISEHLNRPKSLEIEAVLGLALQKVEGSSPFIRSERPRIAGLSLRGATSPRRECERPARPLRNLLGPGTSSEMMCVFRTRLEALLSSL
jgi:hypothetical protein